MVLPRWDGLVLSPASSPRASPRASPRRSLRRAVSASSWDRHFTATMNRTRHKSYGVTESHRPTIMDFGGEVGSGDDRRRESLSRESSDTDFLHRQQEDALIPLKEDLADWLNRLLDIEIGVEDFMDVLDTGVYVCKLAKLIQARVEEAVAAGLSNEHVPKTRLRFKENARSGTWFARDNVANFIRWCREYGVKEECLFETEGLVSHTTPRNFILCLLELGRMAYKYEMDAPCLIAMEKEIDSLEQESCNGSFNNGAFSPVPTILESPLSPAIIQAKVKLSFIDSPPPSNKGLPPDNLTEHRSESPGRESRIPLRKSSSTSSSMSTGTQHSSPSPSSTNRRSLTGDNLLGSPRSTSRSPGRGTSITPGILGSISSGRGSSRSPGRGEASSPGRGASCSPARGGASSPSLNGSRSPARSRRSMVENGAMTMKDSQDMVAITQSTGGQCNGNQEQGTSPIESQSVSVGTIAFLNVQSTGTGMDKSSRTSSRSSSRSPNRSSIPVSTSTTTIGTEMLGSCNGRESASDSPRMVNSGTMTSAVDNRVNTGINTCSPQSDSASTSPSTPKRSSVWRRSVSPSHATRIPVPVGTSAHGMLSHGVSTSSLNSVGNNTPTQPRRRSSIASTPDSVLNVRRRRSSLISNSSETPTANMRRRSSIASINGGTPQNTRRRSSIVSSGCDSPLPGSGTKTPRRRSMSAKSDRSDELDKEVRRISGRCECPQCYQIDRLSEGKYRIGERVVFVRLLKGKHVMVRVGGGWDTLDHYLSTHDPCRVMEVRREPTNNSPHHPWGGGPQQLTAADDKFLFIHGKYKGQTPS